LESLEWRLGSFLAWPWAYTAEVALIGYQLTGDIRFLELLSESIDSILLWRDSECNRIDDLRNRKLQAWGTSIYAENRWINRITLLGRTAFPILQFCRIVKSDKHLRSKFGSKCSVYVSAIEAGFEDFESDFEPLSDGQGAIYRWPLTGQVEPLNHAHTAGNCLVSLWVLTGNETYRQMAEQLALFFKSAIVIQPNGAYTWGYNPTPEQPIGHLPEAVWKGQITLSFVLTAYENGIVFTNDDMIAICETFLSNVQLGENEFNRYISNSKRDRLRDYANTRRKVMGLMGWIFLDRFNPEIRTILTRAIADRIDIFPEGWFQAPQLARGYVSRLAPPGSANTSIFW
jgi:hypothetical protein